MGGERAPKLKQAATRRAADKKSTNPDGSVGIGRTVTPQSGPPAGNAVAASTGQSSQVPIEVIRALSTEPGQPLPRAEDWSPRVGADVGHARIATSAVAAEAAASIGARAFTVGNRVFFAAGNDADTDGGKLLAHELVHVVQQRGAAEPSSWDQLPFVRSHDAHEQAARTGKADRGGDATMAIAMSGDGAAVEAMAYLKDLGWLDIYLRSMFEDDPANVGLQIAADHDAIGRGPFGKYLGKLYGYRRKIVYELSQAGDGYIKAKLASWIAPESLVALIDRARALDWEQPDESKPPVQTNKGSNRVSEATVAIEIANAVVRHYFESIERMFPRVASISVQKNPVLDTTATPVSWNTVKEDEVPVSHPMDLVTRTALLEQGHLSGVHEAYLQAVQDRAVPYGPMEIPQCSAPTMIAFVPEPGLWHWVEVWPGNNTKEQVATLLFGVPEQAYRLTALPPLFGFRTEDIAAFSDVSRQALADKTGLLQQSVDQPVQPAADIDPMTELVNARQPRAAVEHFGQKFEANQAGAVGKSDVHDEANVIDLEKSMIKTLDALYMVVSLFHRPTDPVIDAGARFAVRRDQAIEHSIMKVETAYAFAAKQHTVLSRIAIGIGDAGNRLMAGGGGAAPESVRNPLGDVVDAYLKALAAIEYPEIAEQRLSEADRLAMQIEITLQEASLHERLGELEGEKAENRVKPSALLDPAKHEKSVEEYAMQLADLRIAMRTDPVGAQKKVQDLRPKVDTLGFEIGLGEKLARLNMLWALIDNEEDIWQDGLDEYIGKKLKEQNRALYLRFFYEVFLPFQMAIGANSDKLKLAAQQAYANILRGPQMQEHVKTVKDFLSAVASHKKWKKLIVSLAIAFVAFGLGQWEFGAVLAAEGTLFEAAIAAGVVTTTTTVVLNKVILNQNPTAIGIITGFVANAGTFYVVARLALAAKAAGVAETALAGGSAAEQVTATAAADATSVAATGASTTSKVAGAVGKYAWQFTKEFVIADVIGIAQSQIETAWEHHRLLTPGEIWDLTVNAAISVVGMRVFAAMTPKDLFQYKTPEQKLSAQIKWLKTEREALQVRAKEVADAAKADPLAKPDKAAVDEVLDRWQTYLKREQAAREALLKYAERNPGKFSAAEVEALRGGPADPAATRNVRELKALLAVEPEGINTFSCAAGALDTVIAQHTAVGNEIAKIETDPQTGQRTITIKPADNSPVFQVTERVPPKGMRTAAKVPLGTAREFEGWLEARERPDSTVDGQRQLRDLYARDPAAAINLASEKYGFERRSVAEPEVVVRPDAPGEAAKLAVEPFVSASDHAMGVQLGHGVVAIGEGRFLSSPHEMRDMHKKWAAKEETKASKIHYDPETNTSHFEVEVGGRRVRVEAHLAPRLESFGNLKTGANQIIGERVSQAMGEEILRGVANGEPAMLKATGISGEVVPLGKTIEIGLGKLSTGEHVIVLGEPSAVDWAALPGIEPVGHTHPLHSGNDLQANFQGNKQAPLTEVVGVHPDPHLNRELILPSGQDFIVMADLRITGHKVFTGFVLDNGVIRKPIAGETKPGLEFTIGESNQIGTNDKGQRVYESTIEGKAGKETAISERKIWIVEETPGGHGSLYMSEPVGVTRSSAPSGTPAGSKTPGTLSPAMRKLAAQHGDAAVHWAMDSLPNKDIAPLLQTERALLDVLMDIPAAEARDLIRDAGASRVKRALSGGKAGPITAADLVVLRTRLGGPELIAMLDAAGSNGAALERLANRSHLEAAEVLGKKLDRAKLEALGYSIDKNDVIYRKEGKSATLEPLQIRDGKVAIADYVSAAEVQARILAGLEPTKKTAFETMQKNASPNQKLRLVEGVHDTGVTWDQVFGTGAKREARITQLTDLLTKPRDKGGAGLAPAEAGRLIDGLLNSKETLKIVIGTDPVREAHQYRKGIPEGDIAHHFDPLYLGGGHELIAALPGDAHDAVHRFFDALALPSSANPPGVPLQPNRMQAAVRDVAQPAVVVVDSATGKVTYKLYTQPWQL